MADALTGNVMRNQLKFCKVMKLKIISLLSLAFLHTVQAEVSFPRANATDIALFPQQNEVRNRMDLSGVWKFKTDPENAGEEERWFDGLRDSRSIAVPGCWNEQFTDIRNYLGVSWYETDTYVPESWQGERVFIRVGSANYAARLWINGAPLGCHEGGHIPFAFEITSFVRWGQDNRVAIQVENLLKPDRVPTGNVPGGQFNSFPSANFDFFPYAGLNRAVWLYTLPRERSIKDITVRTNFEGETGIVEVEVEKEGTASRGRLVLSGEGRQIELPIQFEGDRAKEVIRIPNVRRWCPQDPYLYSLSVFLGSEEKTLDHYFLNVGVRTISVTSRQILLNGEPVFLRGFGKHIDFPIFGRATANPVMIKDFELMKWTGANSFRTSHYPYDEEFMDLADREGFLVIDETPSVGLYFHGDEDALEARQKMSKQYIRELIARDKNHPSVIMWCVANEPFPKDIKMSAVGGGEVDPKPIQCLEELTGLVRSLDSTRLVTLVGVMSGPLEWLASCDVVCINRYWGWYTNTGQLENGVKILEMELDGLHRKLNKPVMLTEFGADTMSGFHGVDSEMYTEEFQVDFIRSYLNVAESKDYVVGTHVWNFADFRTGQGLIRFMGMNLKGVFTRDREPKMAAHFLRSRWLEGSDDSSAHEHK